MKLETRAHAAGKYGGPMLSLELRGGGVYVGGWIMADQAQDMLELRSAFAEGIANIDRLMNGTVPSE